MGDSLRGDHQGCGGLGQSADRQEKRKHDGADEQQKGHGAYLQVSTKAVFYNPPFELPGDGHERIKAVRADMPAPPVAVKKPE